MSRCIYKFPLLQSSVFTIQMQKSAIIRALQLQNDVPTLWVEVNPDLVVNDPRKFVVLGTGQEIPPSAQYVGTWQNGSFVWHLYEVTRA